MKFTAMFICLLFVQTYGMCNLYPLDEVKCVTSTYNLSCQFNYFENLCLETQSIRLGCQSNLNQNACLQQQYNLNGSEAQCYFGQKCINANQFHLSQLDCSKNFSKFACLSLQQNCVWNGQICQSYDFVSNSSVTCSSVIGMACSPRLCALITDLRCYNNGSDNGYFCTDVLDEQLLTFKCNTLGLNKLGCIGIITNEEKCIYHNNECKYYSSDLQNTCSDNLNKAACLGITDINLTCTWTSSGCQDYTIDSSKSCEDYINISSSVCINTSQNCKFNSNTHSCETINSFDNLTCQETGLSKSSCLLINKYPCIFTTTGCQSLTAEDLNLYNCNDNLNYQACINLSTPFQTCEWNGSTCQRMILNQNTDCVLTFSEGQNNQVNGNVCKAISKQGVGCKYNSTTHLCILTSGTEECSNTYLNLYGCVQISSGVTCNWSDSLQQCQTVKVIDQQTKCTDLGFTNPISCSQITEVDSNGNFLMCYYNSNTQQCAYADQDTIATMECTQEGLNKYGCTQITKVGQRCRWVRSACTQVSSREEIAQVTCLELQFVSPNTCSLVTAEKSVCKFNSNALGCMNTANFSDTGDYCTTQGLNAIACQQITRNPTGCYYDQVNNICLTAPNSSSSLQSDIAASETLLTSAKCILSYPTLSVCRSIKTTGELCAWNNRSSSCVYQNVLFNQQCSDYQSTSSNTINVNANVCASILMNYPNYDPSQGSTLKVDEYRGFCYFNGSGNCSVFKNKICTDNCCSTFQGINAHVCSRFSKQTAYCYFNEYNQCVELTQNDTDITSQDQIKAYYNYKQYKCSSMNTNTCWMIDWSPRQQCYVTDSNVCVQINYNDISNFVVFSGIYTMSKYGCLGIEGANVTYRYFRYNPTTHYCYYSAAAVTQCDADLVNKNVCLGQSTADGVYCQWDKDNLACTTLVDYLSLYTCNEYQNINACINNPYTPCVFLLKSDKCIPSPQQVTCTHFTIASNTYYGKVNQLACQNISMGGQICTFYQATNVCVAASSLSVDGCDVSGYNSIGCYLKTTGNCRWNWDTFQCFEEGDSETLANLKCSDNINKILCLSINSDTCEWSTSDSICQTIESLSQIDSSNFYNAQTCTSLIGGAYYFNSSNNTCVSLTTFNNACNQYVMNKQACLLNTQGSRCIFDSTLSPNKKCYEYKEQQLVCSSSLNINIEICMNIPNLCYFSESTLSCVSTKVSASAKCSTLISDTLHYNKLACSSISATITDASTDSTTKICISSPSIANNAQQCYFEKYCFWDSTIYGCALAKIANASYQAGSEFSSPSCSLSAKTFACTQIYSQALCLQFGSNCYFDISQGGCLPYSQNLYTLSNCLYLNGNQCDLSKTPLAYCTTQASDTDYTTDCSIDASITSTCIADTSIVSNTCLSLSGETQASKCASASDYCYLSTYCTVPSTTTNITCTTSGVSQSLCLSLYPPCDFTSGSCTSLTIPSLRSDQINFYQVCSSVNLLITNYNDYACGSITTTPCMYSSESCQNAFYQSCSTLTGLVVSQLACTQSKDNPCIYNSTSQSCTIVSDLSTNCDSISGQANCTSNTQCEWNITTLKCMIKLAFLNKSSCLTLTKSIYAKWNSDTESCIQLTLSQTQTQSDCTLVGIQGCYKVTSNVCWVDSTTNQCAAFKSIKLTCSEINQQNGLQSHCLSSYVEPCKWVSNQCVSANLSVDSCNVLNKYGCVNMTQKIYCGWSDTNNQCKLITISLVSGCSKYTLATNSTYTQVNPYVCQSLTTGNCYFDPNTNQCTSAGIVQLKCSSNLGINQNACILSTEDSCKYDTSAKQCIPTTSTDTTCTINLNQVACITMTTTYCYFNTILDNCYPYTPYGTKAAAALKLPYYFIISYNVCTNYNNNITGAYFVYSTQQGQCVATDTTYPSQFFAKCQEIGITQAICLQTTNPYCQYVDQTCSEITLLQIQSQTTCNSAYNWYACITISMRCKFVNGLCQNVLDTDTCASLAAITNARVASSICASMNTPCKYNNDTLNCQVVTSTTEICSATGMSKQACLQYTTTSFCYFDVATNICSYNYDQTLPCQDSNQTKSWYINAKKCYFLRTLGNYCQFSNGECLPIDSSLLVTCLTSQNTNPISCTIAQTGICYYKGNTCFVGTQAQLNALDSTNIISFNKIACLSYNNVTTKKQLIWDEVSGCLEVSSDDLINLSCTSLVNQMACVSITNPTQFCQFNTTLMRCVGFDYTVPPSLPIGTCSQFTYVNRYEFCQYVSNDCMYNTLTYSCLTVTTPSSIQILTASDCFYKGFSQSLCVPTKLSLCSYNTSLKFCYGGNIFCSNNTPTTCNSVKVEACQIQNNQCVGISYSNLDIATCQDVANSYGCTAITNVQQMCQFNINTQTCNTITNLNQKCAAFTYINNKKICEQTTNIACKFDYATKACVEVESTDIFECNRGLNQLACINYTRSSLQCKFGKFCYGPTYGVSQCSDSTNIETCLNYNYQCTWDTVNLICQDYNVLNQLCSDLQTNSTIVSRQVCYNSVVDEGQSCVYNFDQHTCELIDSLTCIQMETQQQCKSLQDLPCIWSDDTCNFVTLTETDPCSSVGEYGTKRACMDVQRQGEQCQYFEDNCTAFKEDIINNNCLSNINKNACVSQQTSKCQWIIQSKTVYTTLVDTKEYQFGICQEYIEANNEGCSSSLSYSACFSIIKKGEYCIWLNGYCQSIVSSGTIYYNTYSLINSNACGLVNVSKVRYNEQTKSCAIIQNEVISCKCGSETKGLNKQACLSIKNQQSKWNRKFNICVEYGTTCDSSITRLLSNQYNQISNQCIVFYNQFECSSNSECNWNETIRECIQNENLYIQQKQTLSGQKMFIKLAILLFIFLYH